MCGIVGIFDQNALPIDKALLERMSGAIRHRGPDGEGKFMTSGVGLGIRRLSIIDVAGGTQPLANEDGSIRVVSNGEIYNYIELREELVHCGHQFKTHCDTEVIVHAYEEWGANCVNRLNGMFAFALWSDRERQLLLVRDHLGIKPLYYVVIGSRILFASEIKALLEDEHCPQEVDLGSLAELFSLRFVPSPNTLFKGIKKLSPGHRMTLHGSAMRIERFWNTKPVLRERIDEESLIQEYQVLLEDAVRIQMRSDFPVGLFLSSGMDSCTILALMNRHSPRPVRTFTIGFEDNGGNDETADARVTARMFNADHTEMIVKAADYQKYYDRYLWDLEEPVGNESAAAYYFLSFVASQKAKVALNGEGADELWAGYDRYKGLKLSRHYRKLPSFATSALGSTILDNIVRNEKLKRALLSLNEENLLARFVKIYSFFSTGMKARLFRPWLQEQISIDGHEAREAIGRLQADVSDLDALTQMLYIDTRADLPDDLLMVCDKTSMANSLEVRLPFLDVRLVEFIETLPPSLKLRGLHGKYLHKKASEKWIPKEIVRRKKKGFANPVNVWFRTRMHCFVNECLLSDDSAVSHYFNRSYLQHIVRTHESGQQNYLRQIQLLISFELWHRMFISGKRPSAVLLC